jgi:hypothetical protein
VTAPPTAAVLDGLALHRATGAPALACLAGYRSVDRTRPGTTLAAAADAAGAAGSTDLAMLVDLAAGAAIRSRIGGDRRLATTSLAVHLLGALPPTADLAVHVPEVAELGRLAVASTTVLAGAEVVGTGSVAFAVLGDGLPPIPWEQAGPTPHGPLREEDLTPDEQDGLRHSRSAGARSWSEAVLRGSTQRSPAGLVLRPSTLMANRVGGVQGGVLVGLAVLAAEAPDGSSVLGSVQVDFVSAATVDASVTARVEVLRESRRSRLLRVALVQSDTLVVAATVGLRTG